MAAVTAEATVGELVVQNPARSRVFESVGIDYCCGGRKPLADACREKDLDPNSVICLLERSDASPASTERDWSHATLTELADHIESTHHAFLRRELPRLRWLTDRVASVHGHNHPQLHSIREIFAAFAMELETHMSREERELFPAIRRLEMEDGSPTGNDLPASLPSFEHDHNQTGRDLARLRELSDNYIPPEGACNTYRAMLSGLAEVERDMHRHVHQENNILFPRAATLARRQGRYESAT